MATFTTYRGRGLWGEGTVMTTVVLIGNEGTERASDPPAVGSWWRQSWGLPIPLEPPTSVHC